jgi:hypothetical protein
MMENPADAINAAAGTLTEIPDDLLQGLAHEAKARFIRDVGAPQGKLKMELRIPIWGEGEDTIVVTAQVSDGATERSYPIEVTRRAVSDAQGLGH